MRACFHSRFRFTEVSVPCGDLVVLSLLGGLDLSSRGVCLFDMSARRVCVLGSTVSSGCKRAATPSSLGSVLYGFVSSVPLFESRTLGGSRWWGDESWWLGVGAVWARNTTGLEVAVGIPKCPV